MHLIKKMNFLLVALMSIVSLSSMASKVPVMTSVKMSVANASTGTYKFEWASKIMEVGPAGDVKPTPGWYVSVISQHNAGAGKWQGAVEDGWSHVEAGETISDATLRQFAINGDTGVFYDNNSTCVGWGAQSDNFSAWGSQIMPAGCMVFPPAEEWCKITTPEIILDHGTLTLRDAENNSVTKQMGVQCTSEMTVTFNLVTNDSYVYLDEGKSEITVNNQPLNSAIPLPSGDSEVTIKDLLTGVTSAGAHTGSSVLVMMPD